MSELIILDVGHGNSAILEDGEDVAVIDAPIGALLLDTLRDRDIKVIDSVFISHSDSDHIAGILALITSTDFDITRIYVNPDARKETSIWRSFQAAIAVKEKQGTCPDMHVLTRQTNSNLTIGKTQIEVVAPPHSTFLAGSGSSTLTGRSIDGNSLSAAIRIGGQEGILLAGDLDDVGLMEAISVGADLSAKVLIFPHHGGRPGRADPSKFTTDILAAVDPESVVFSIGRNKHNNPRDDVASIIYQAGCQIACTQLSMRCDASAPKSVLHLEEIRAAGRDAGYCCAGSQTFILGSSTKRAQVAESEHQKFIDDHVALPLCRGMKIQV